MSVLLAVSREYTEPKGILASKGTIKCIVIGGPSKPTHMLISLD